MHVASAVTTFTPNIPQPMIQDIYSTYRLQTNHKLIYTNLPVVLKTSWVWRYYQLWRYKNWLGLEIKLVSTYVSVVVFLVIVIKLSLRNYQHIVVKVQQWICLAILQIIEWKVAM